MKVREIKELSARELAVKVGEKEDELANLKFQLALHQLDNTSKVQSARRDLARMKTILKESQMGIRKLAESDTGEAK